MTAPDLRVRDPRVRKAERIGSDLAVAMTRLNQAKASKCGSPQDVTFWQCEVARLRAQYDEVFA